MPRAALIGGLAYVGATFAVGAVVMSGGALAAAIAAAVLAGGTGGLIGSALAHWVGHHHAAYLHDQIENGGLLLWVRAWNESDEARALEIIAKACGGHGSLAQHLRSTSLTPVASGRPTRFRLAADCNTPKRGRTCRPVDAALDRAGRAANLRPRRSNSPVVGSIPRSAGEIEPRLPETARATQRRDAASCHCRRQGRRSAAPRRGRATSSRLPGRAPGFSSISSICLAQAASGPARRLTQLSAVDGGKIRRIGTGSVIIHLAA